MNGSRVRVQETGAKRRSLTVERLAGGFRRRSGDGREKEGFPQAEERVEMAAIKAWFWGECSRIVTRDWLSNGLLGIVDGATS